MELLRFIKWQWNRLQYDEIVLGLDAIITCSTLAYVWYTFNFFLALMISICVFFGVVVIAMIGQRIIKQWRLYKEHQEKEARRIVDKLRGSSH